MTKIHVPNWSERTGTAYWQDRIERMKHQDDNKLEQGKMLMFDRLMSLPGKKEKLADIGCGIGRRHVQYPGVDYYGFDRESIMVDEARKRYPHLTFNLVDAQEIEQTLPQFKGFFDILTTFHVVQYNHVEQQAEIFKGFRHLLRDGGYMYLKENTVYEHNNDGTYPDITATHSANNYSYTEAGWTAAFKSAGFELLDTCGFQGHFILQKVG